MPLSYKRLPVRLYQVNVLPLIAFVSRIVTLNVKLFTVYSMLLLFVMASMKMFFYLFIILELCLPNVQMSVIYSVVVSLRKITG